MKKPLKFVLLALLSVFLVAGTAMALPLPSADFGGVYWVDTTSWVVTGSTVNIDEVVYKDSTSSATDPVVGAPVYSGMAGWNYDIDSDTLTIASDATNDFSIGSFLSGTLSQYDVDKLAAGIFSVDALLTEMAYNAQSSRFIEEFQEGTSPSDRAQVVSFHIALGGVVNDQLTVNAFGKVAPVPEPATMLLLGAGLIGMGALGRKRIFKK